MRCFAAIGTDQATHAALQAFSWDTGCSSGMLHCWHRPHCLVCNNLAARPFITSEHDLVDVTRVLTMLALPLCRCVLGMQRVKDALSKGNATKLEHVKTQ
jgi:hypothetical protein